jgi:hypothetical protein
MRAMVRGSQKKERTNPIDFLTQAIAIWHIKSQEVIAAGVEESHL